MAETNQVPVFILAGGIGSRLSEETLIKPKPMVEIGGIPILVHIMRHYYCQGFNDFVICAGYRSWEIKNYFLNYPYRMNHLALDHRLNQERAAQFIGVNSVQERWRVRVIDTGANSMTGARLARAFDIVSEEQEIKDFALTYGDGLSNVDVSKEFEFHREHGRTGTVLGVRSIGRFGVLKVSEDSVAGFIEKPEERKDMINGGFFFFKREFREYVSPAEQCILEREPLEKLAQDRKLMVYRHTDFWHPMDTLRDCNHLEKLWNSGNPPWPSRSENSL